MPYEKHFGANGHTGNCLSRLHSDKNGGTDSNGTNNLETLKVTAILLEEFADF